MPEIYRIDGIIICMYPLGADHEPIHIHARYGEYEAKFSISDGSLLIGIMPPKCIKKIKTFIEEHKTDLVDMWSTQRIRKLN